MPKNLPISRAICLINLLAFAFLLPACSRHPTGYPQFTIDAPGNSSQEVRVSEWQLSKDRNKWDSSYRYVVQDDYIDLGKFFPDTARKDYYSACMINSSVEQSVAFLMGGSGTLQLWINDSVWLPETKSRTERNENVLPVHLRKGKNLIVLKIGGVGEKKTFYFTISTLAYASRIYYLYNASNFLEKPLVGRGDSLGIVLNGGLLPSGDSMNIALYDLHDRELSTRTVQRDNRYHMSLSVLPDTGLYVCRVKTGGLVFEQNLIYGDHAGMFKALEKAASPYCKSDPVRINIETMLVRYQHLDSAGKHDGFDNLLGRKVAITLSDLAISIGHLTNREDGFAGIPGLHLRGYRSAIDGGIDHYMLYVPPGYDPKKPIPMVIVMPFITNQLPFIKSWRVADINGIDMVNHLAAKYGYAVLSPSSRIYDHCNLNPITDRSTFEAIAAVQRDYHIDGSRLYLYGSCAGGLFALVQGNRYPSIFAAIGAKGPELSYTDPAEPYSSYSPEWLYKNNILNFPMNYGHLPIYIIHSQKDKKANYGYTSKLAEAINRSHGDIMLETIADASKTKDFDLYPTGEITDKMFSFFTDKQLKQPVSIDFSTAQLKYNQAYWISINEMVSSEKVARIKAEYKGDNRIEVITDNVEEFVIDLLKVPGIDMSKSVLVLNNEQTGYSGLPPDPMIVIRKGQTPRLAKTHLQEGPANDIFNSGFLLVQGTIGSKNEIESIRLSAKSFIDNWGNMYHTACRLKKDIEVSSSDMDTYNLILLGSPASNSIIKELAPRLPFQISKDSIVIRNKTVRGNDLQYTLLYPNPLHPARYILLSGCNDSATLPKAFELAYKGWYDYDIHSRSSAVHERGVYNIYWK